MKDRRTVSRADYEQVSDDLAHALAEIGMLEAEIERLTELVKDASVPWHARYLQQDFEIERLRAALRFYGKDAAWSETVIDSYSGEVVLFDWDGDIADEPWEVAEAALKGAEDE